MEDESLARLLTEWSLLSEREIAEARDVQSRLKVAGGHHTLEKVLVDFGFLTRRQLDDAIAVTEGQPPPGEDLPLDVVEAMHKPEAKFGHFLLLNEIGRGGLGVVHRAWDTEVRRVMALKFLRSEASLNPSRVIELLQEGSRLSRLRHPNIITVHEFGRIRSQFYLAMDLLEGMGLDHLIRSAKARNHLSPFYDNPKRYLAVFRDIARAVHYTHTRTPPLLHCDLKPQNIFVDLSWRPFLVDFGVARELRHDTPSEGTKITGSPAYMAPEQVLGQQDQIDVRTDIYGLGAILYELLTGRPPIVAESVQEALDKNLLVEPPEPSKVVAARVAISTSAGAKPTVPPELEAICMRCIAKDKKDRYQSARDVAEAIDPLVGDKPLRVRVETMPTVKAPAPAEAAHPEGRETRRAIKKTVQRSMRRASLIGFVVGVAVIGAVAVGVSMFLGGNTAWSQRDAVQAAADAYASRLDVETAQSRYKEFGDEVNDKATSEWIARHLEELEFIRQFRDQLVVVLGRERPQLPLLKLRDGELRNVTVTSASFYQLTVRGDEERPVSWALVSPKQVMELAWQWPFEFTGKTRLGLAVFAIKNKLWPEAKTVLDGLDDPMAARYLSELPVGK